LRVLGTYFCPSGIVQYNLVKKQARKMGLKFDVGF
jgi:hypothetical protein